MRYNRYVTNLLVCTISNRIAFFLSGCIKAKLKNGYVNTILLAFILIFSSNAAHAVTFYISPSGNDYNTGTSSSPFATLQKLNTVLTAGDIAYVRGGTYTAATSNTWYQTRWHNLTGTVNDTIKIYAYPGETPVFDYASHNFGIATSWLVQMYECDYVHVKGLTFTNATQPASSPIIGFNLTNSSHNLIEFVTLSHIGGFGFSIGSEGWATGDLNTANSEYNTFLNCDAFDCSDPTSPQPFGGANGFNITHNNGVSNPYAPNTVFRNCRAWNCSDDGWDFFGSDSYPITVENCWSFWNGIQFGGTVFAGDGDGYKLGPNLVDLTTTHTTTLKNCISAGNRNMGFDQNTCWGAPCNGTVTTSIHWLYNCFAYNNGWVGFMYEYPARTANHVFRNNVAFGNGQFQTSFSGTYTHSNNDFDSSPSVTANASDYVSLDITQLDNARGADGSLPFITFGHLVLGSDLIDAGVDVGITYTGTAPDIGAFEYSNSSNNNQPPSIQNQGFLINENSPNGTMVGMVLASDPDAGQTLSYSILSGNTSGAFSINTSTGVLTVSNLAALNFEITPTFALVVKVQDNGTGNLNSQAIVTVSLTDVNEVPVINNQFFSIAENSANGTIVGTVIATNPDAGQTLTYSILSGNTSEAFAIITSTGVLTVSDSAALNFETTPTFALVVKVQDNGTGNLSSLATVTVSLSDVNEAPVINNQSFSIAENSASGTIIGTIIATNPDAGQTLTYSILSGNTSEAFAINTSTGVLTVSDSAALNFEITPTFALVVKVQDNGTGNLSSLATVTVSLSDVNEAPVINNQSFSVAENSANGTIVGTVIATNPDAGQTLTYSILSGNTSEAFAIRASTGVLTVANSSALNFETTPTFELLVKVQDNGTGNLSSQAIIQININDSTAFVNIDTITLSNNYETGTNYLLDFYPNPTTGFININCEKVDVNLLNLQLYTISGLIVYQKTYSWAKTISLNIDSNQKNTYILVVRSKGKIYTGKIIVN